MAEIAETESEIGTPDQRTFITVAGAAAERSRGKGRAMLSVWDLDLCPASAPARLRCEVLAEDFFRLPEVAALLDKAARFLYARWGTGEVPGEDLLTAIGEKRYGYVSLPEVVNAAAERLAEEADAEERGEAASRRR